ncbi:MAG: site-2 protease family protein [Cyanobacteria bacterium J06627_28]
MLLQSLSTNPVYVLRFIVIIIISITLHELGHGAAAIYQGDQTPVESGHMTWNPVVHMGWPSLIMLCLMGMAWGQMPVRPQRFRDGGVGHMMVAAAGPMTNFAIAAVCIIVIHLFSEWYAVPISLEFFYLAANINVGLGLFNLLPIPPLDGFTVFSELFPSFKGIRNHPAATACLLILFVTGSLQIIWMAADFIVLGLTPSIIS